MLVFKCIIEVHDNTLVNACSGQRVIVEEKNDEKDHGRQSMVTIQVSYIHQMYNYGITYQRLLSEWHPDTFD